MEDAVDLELFLLAQLVNNLNYKTSISTFNLNLVLRYLVHR